MHLKELLATLATYNTANGESHMDRGSAVTAATNALAVLTEEGVAIPKNLFAVFKTNEARRLVLLSYVVSSLEVLKEDSKHTGTP